LEYEQKEAKRQVGDTKDNDLQKECLGVIFFREEIFVWVLCCTSTSRIWGSRNMKDWFFTCECRRDLDVLSGNFPNFTSSKHLEGFLGRENCLVHVRGSG